MTWGELAGVGVTITCFFAPKLWQAYRRAFPKATDCRPGDVLGLCMNRRIVKRRVQQWSTLYTAGTWKTETLYSDGSATTLHSDGSVNRQPGKWSNIPRWQRRRRRRAIARVPSRLDAFG